MISSFVNVIENVEAQLFPFAKYGEQARKVLETLLDKYVR
jgi:hypothetical protein